MFCIDELSISILNTLEYGFFSESVPVLVYYSHLTAIIVSLFLGAFVYSNSRKLPSKILFSITIIFSILAVLDIFLWTQINSSVLMFLWSFWLFLFSTIFSLSFYFLYSLLRDKDVSFTSKLITCIGLLTILLFSLTKFNLESFDIPNCTAVEGVWMINIVFGLSFLLFFATVLFGIREAIKSVDVLAKKQAIFATIGMSCFLIMFAGASYFASIANMFGGEPDTFKLEQYGYFGMTIFIGFLTYLIVRYKAFNIKLLAAQALVFALVALIASEFFFVRNTTNKILTGVTLFLAIGFGFFLVRSVKREIEQRERIEKLAKELQETNERQEVLFHFIGHEVKGFLTKDAASFASLIDGDFGPLPDALKPFVTQALAQSRDGARSVTDILTASNQKKGTVSYTKESFDLKALATEIAEKIKPIAEGKGLTFTFTVDDAGTPYIFNGDKGKIGDNVFRNIIDNSINYTPSGSVSVSLKKNENKFIFTVKDTGIGITEEDKKRLFTEGGHGKNSQTVNVHSTGYGLFIAKNIIEAHNGTIRAESEGEGKGATFVVELPA